jgi:hypothetical protein
MEINIELMTRGNNHGFLSTTVKKEVSYVILSQKSLVFLSYINYWPQEPLEATLVS